MKIAVIGAGAIGCLVAGYLKLRKQDVLLTGRSDSVKAIRQDGLKISGVRGNFNIRVEAQEKLNHKLDLVILCTKSQDIQAAIKDSLEFIKQTTILTTQNGIRADNLASQYIPKENIISSIVMFGSTYLEQARSAFHFEGELILDRPWAKIVHNFEGKWILGRPFSKNDSKVQEMAGVLNKIFPVVISDDILGMKWLKVFVNANNCLPAILGKSMQETFKDLNICKISIRIWQEGLDIINKAGIKLVSLPDFPLERLTKLTTLPLEESAKIFSGIMTNLSQEPLYGSILQSIKRGRLSEIDFINGEFMSLAKKNNLSAPLNEKLANLVHRVEESKNFLTQQELLENTNNF